MNWIKTNNEDSSTLPPLEKVVWIIYLSNYDDGEVVAFGGRVDDSDGWLWALLDDTRGYRKDGQHHDLMIEDDYHVTHWAEIQWPEG